MTTRWRPFRRKIWGTFGEFSLFYGCHTRTNAWSQAIRLIFGSGLTGQFWAAGSGQMWSLNMRAFSGTVNGQCLKATNDDRFSGLIVLRFTWWNAKNNFRISRTCSDNSKKWEFTSFLCKFIHTISYYKFADKQIGILNSTSAPQKSKSHPHVIWFVCNQNRKSKTNWTRPRGKIRASVWKISTKSRCFFSDNQGRLGTLNAEPRHSNENHGNLTSSLRGIPLSLK